MASTNSCLTATAIGAEQAAERQRAGVAHEDLRRRRVEPQKAEARADQRAADDREFAGAGDVIDARGRSENTELPTR